MKPDKADEVLKYVFNNHTLEYPILSCQLERKFNLVGSEIRAIASYWRKNGYPLLSCSAGYFWPKDQRDIGVGTKHLRSRAIKLLKQYSMLNNINLRQLELELGEKYFRLV